MKTYAILGAGGSFGIHTAFYLLDNAELMLLDLEALVELRLAPGFQFFAGYRSIDIG